MARHWSVFCGGVTEKQGMALDRMARLHGIGDGMDLLMKLTGSSRSKVGRMDRASLRPYLDKAFERYADPPAAKPADALTQAVESGIARVNGEATASYDLSSVPTEVLRAELARRGVAAESKEDHHG